MLTLAFASGEASLSVRRFAVRERISSLFDVHVMARSPNDDLDLESIVGAAAALTIGGGPLDLFGAHRRFAGVCSDLELVGVESDGLSTYRIAIAPTLWLLTQRTNHRLFQRKRVPEILDALLADWGITPEWRLRPADHPKLELRVQYGESDFAFFSRLLEEAGISYYFVDDDRAASRLVLTDAPHAAEARAGLPIPYVDAASQAGDRAHVRELSLTRVVRPGKLGLRDHDFRKAPSYELVGAPPAVGLQGIEDRLEVYRYRPGASLVELETPPGARADADVPPSRTDPVAARDPAPPPPPPQEPPPGGAHESKLGRLFDRAVDGLVEKAKEKAKSALVSKASDFVGAKVGRAIERNVGGLAGQLLAGIASDAASSIAAKVAGRVATAALAPRETQASDDRGAVRHDEKAVHRRSQVELEALRSSAYTLELRTNLLDLAPGTVFSIAHHPRRDLAPTERLLVTQLRIDGAPGEDFELRLVAAFARAPYRPAHATPKPTVQGVQSAAVVGPAGEEIHTDELGRVRVQFHWDREGRRDDHSSCWMRVSQGWAGAGYGMIAIPRVGTEVLVAFLEGDPDLPIVIGSLFGGTARPPHALPEHRTRSAWRGSSSPGGQGANEIMLEDAAGRELVYLHAERDLQAVVRHDRGAVVGRDDSTIVGDRWAVHVAQPASPPPSVAATGATIVDRKITFTTGEASITLDGPDILIEAKGRIVVRSEGDDVVLRGGPRLLLNCSAASDRAASSPVAAGPTDAPPAPAGEGAPAGSTPVTPPPITTGLGAGVDAGVAQSPTLRTKVEQMQRAGWRMEYGAPGSGSSADRSTKLVLIDGNERGRDAAVLQTLAHESGHATYTMDPYVSPDGLTRRQFVDRNAMRSLKDEGEATLTNVQVRDELRAAGRPDIGVGGVQASDYERIAATYPAAADRDRAREEIGRLFANGEHPSTDPSKTYGAYYGESYESFYDQQQHATTSP